MARSTRPGGMTPGTHSRIGDPGLGEHVLADDVRLAGEQAAPGRAQQPDEVGPQRRAARGVDGRRGQHGDQAGVGDQGGVATPASHRRCEITSEYREHDEHRHGGPPHRKPLPDRAEHREQGAQGIAQVLAEPTTGQAGRLRPGARRREVDSG